MIRVGFILSSSVAKWNGGINYYSNIFRILNKTDFVPVLLCSPEMKKIVESKFADYEVSYYDFLSYNSFSDKVRKSILYTTSYEPFLDHIIKVKHIDVMSHNDRYPLNAKTKVNSCSWIPDLQSFRLPELQTDKANRRERWLWKQLIKNSTYVIVSSYDSMKDLLEMFPDTPPEKIKVLHFTVPPIKESVFKNKFNENQLSKYNVSAYSYFVISNQFWAHKNHITVAKALNYLFKKHGKDLTFSIIATGLTKDPRGMKYFDELKAYIMEHHLDCKFVLTGNIPYTDVQLLQHYSIAVIQPSLFEGWNTTVEECKATGKKILLSNINVQIEQAPDNCAYFDPYNPKELALLMKDTVEQFNIEKEKALECKALREQPNRWNDFSKQYIQILNDTINA